MISDNVIDETTAEDGTPFRVVIERDECGYETDSPRDWDGNVGRIVAITRDSRNGDAPQEEDAMQPRTSRANAATIVDAIQDHSFAVVARWLRVFHGATVVLPLWDISTVHGAPELSAGDMTDRPGADGYSGVIFDTPYTRKTSGIAVDYVESALRDEVELYAMWARGDVFGWVIEQGKTDADGETTWTGERPDGVWGYIGAEDAAEQGRVALDDFIRAYDRENPGTDEDDELAYAETAGAHPSAVAWQSIPA